MLILMLILILISVLSFMLILIEHNKRIVISIKKIMLSVALVCLFVCLSFVFVSNITQRVMIRLRSNFMEGFKVPPW